MPTGKKTTVVLGAGPGVGLSLARRFGAEDQRIVLVSRNQDRLERFASDLRANGIDALARQGDVADRTGLERTLDAILETTGRIDTLYYGPGGFNPGFRPPHVLDADPESLQPILDMFLHSPIAAVRRVLPAMLERGDGALLFASGTTARDPAPMLGGMSPALAATRNYVFALHEAVRDKGVYAGVLLIGGLIDRSEVAEAVRADPTLLGDATGVPTIDPDDIAAAAWRMTVDRTSVEEVFTGPEG